MYYFVFNWFQGIGLPDSGPPTPMPTPTPTPTPTPPGESGGNTNNGETELDLVALGIDKENVTSEDLCKLVSGSSRKKRQVASGTDNQGNERSDNGNRQNEEEQRNGGNNEEEQGNGENNEAEQRSSTSASSGSTTPMVDIFVNPQKAEVRKAFEEQTVKKYQNVFANIDLKKVIICILNPSFSLEILI